MRAEGVVYALLGASAGVNALVAGRIFPSRLPQNTAMPAIAYELISATEVLPIDALAGSQLLRSRVQVHCLSKQYSELKAMHEAVRLALLYKSGSIALGGGLGSVRVLAITRELIGPDQRDDQLSLYLQSVDYMVSHYET